MTVKLVPLMAVPPAVVTLIGPEGPILGTGIPSFVALAPVTVAAIPSIETRSPVASGSKLVPVIVTASPTRPIVGENEAIVGSAKYVNAAGMVAVPAGVVTVTSAGPAAPAGVTVEMLDG